MTTEDDWRRLNKDSRDNGIALALGSCVSAACKLPDWCDLLERIAIRCYGRRGQKRFNEMGFNLFGKVILPHVCDHFGLANMRILASPQLDGRTQEFILSSCSTNPNPTILALH